mmetsp:Transcript_59764/g.110607  ORF Transcript_59764/g.110607 Transcript_59764/m.110607 type:complete len:230 (+) Transcript_59764:430-1119(+)
MGDVLMVTQQRHCCPQVLLYRLWIHLLAITTHPRKQAALDSACWTLRCSCTRRHMTELNLQSSLRQNLDYAEDIGIARSQVLHVVGHAWWRRRWWITIRLWWRMDVRPNLQLHVSVKTASRLHGKGTYRRVQQGLVFYVLASHSEQDLLRVYPQHALRSEHKPVRAHRVRKVDMLVRQKDWSGRCLKHLFSLPWICPCSFMLQETHEGVEGVSLSNCCSLAQMCRRGRL